MFSLGGLAVVLGVFYFFVKRSAPKPVPALYASPEIEIETFERAGYIPDLNAIEAALLLGNTSKVLTLVLMGLASKGVVEVVNRSPLQLTILDTSGGGEDYEKALLDAIADDGTLSRPGIDRVMALLSAQLQPKVWNADMRKTRETYVERADSAWDTWSGEPVQRSPSLGDAWMWALLSQHYQPRAEISPPPDRHNYWRDTAIAGRHSG